MSTPAELRNELNGMKAYIEILKAQNASTAQSSQIAEDAQSPESRFYVHLANLEARRNELDNALEHITSPLELLNHELAIANLRKDILDYEIDKAETEVKIRAFKRMQPHYAPVHAIQEDIKRIYDRVARRENIENNSNNKETIERRMRFYEGMQVKRFAKRAKGLAEKIEDSEFIKSIKKQQNVELSYITSAFSNQRMESEYLDNRINVISEQLMALNRHNQQQALEDPNKVLELARDLFSKWENLHVLHPNQQSEFMNKIEGLAQAISHVQDEAALMELSRIVNEQKTAIDSKIKYQAYLAEEDVDKNYNPKTFEQILQSKNTTIAPYATLWQKVDSIKFTVRPDIDLDDSTSDASILELSPRASSNSLDIPISSSSSSSYSATDSSSEEGPSIDEPTVQTQPSHAESTAEQSRAKVIAPLQGVAKQAESSRHVQNLKEKYEQLIREKQIEAEKAKPPSTTRPPRKT